ncbi:MAG: glycine cleavage system H protein [Saprospiraceae bacterium]
MKEVDQHAFYSQNHEWVRKDLPLHTVGLTDFGQSCCKEITQVSLPKVGQYFRKGEICCVLESVKSANDVEMPISGTIVQANDQLKREPSLINSDCYGKGWLVKIVPSDLTELGVLLTAENYRKEIGVFFRKNN